MTMPFRAVVAASLLAAALASGLAQAGLSEGLDALRKRDYATAAKELRPLADKGNAEAQFRIGLMYEHGAGYPQDKAQGVAWLRKAANQGHAGAQQELGVIYTTGDGVPADHAQAAAWFRKAADQGNEAAQYNLGLLYAKGQGVKQDSVEAVRWFRLSGQKGFALAVSKLGIAYEVGEGVSKDMVLAYIHYAIAARTGNREYAAQRDAVAAKLRTFDLKAGQAVASAWQVGQPLPTSVRFAGSAPPAQAATPPAAAAPPPAAARAPAPDRCKASGTMAGQSFSASHCAVALMADQRSVAIWFNESPIAPAEAAEFQLSSYAKDSVGGKPRTLVQVMFCPSGGAATPASPAALKKIDFNSNHARAPLAGVQNLLEAPKDFRVEKLAGTVEPGGVLSGRIVGKHGTSAWTLEFDVTLPTKDAAAGLACR